jgi:hypothetical protein
MEAECLPQQPPRAIAHHGPADPAAGDHAQARRRTPRQPLPVGDQAAEGQPLTALAQPGEIPALLDACRAAKPQALWHTGGHGPACYTGVKRLRPTRRRLARMPRPLLLALRARKPCCRLRRTFDGWYCRFINQFSSSPAGAHPQDRCVRKHSANGAREHNSEPPPVKRTKLGGKASAPHAICPGTSGSHSARRLDRTGARPGDRARERMEKTQTSLGRRHAQPGASLLRACGWRVVSVMLRWYFDGISMYLRCIFDGFQGFLPLLLQSGLLAHPPCQPPFLHFSLYPYKRCRSQKVTPLVWRRCRPQPPRIE